LGPRSRQSILLNKELAKKSQIEISNIRLGYELKPAGKSLPGAVDFEKTAGRRPFSQTRHDYDPLGKQF